MVSRPSFSGALLGGASKISGTRQEVKTFEFRLSADASLLLRRFGRYWFTTRDTIGRGRATAIVTDFCSLAVTFLLVAGNPVCNRQLRSWLGAGLQIQILGISPGPREGITRSTTSLYCSGALRQEEQTARCCCSFPVVPWLGRPRLKQHGAQGTRHGSTVRQRPSSSMNAGRYHRAESRRKPPSRSCFRNLSRPRK